MPHIINVRHDSEADMRAYAGKMPEIIPKMAKYSWVKTLTGLPTIAKLAIGLIAYPVAYLRDWCNKRTIKHYTLEEANNATRAQLQIDLPSADLPARRVLDTFGSANVSSELECGFLEKTTSRYRQRLKENAEQFVKKQFPFPCVLKPRLNDNTDEVDTGKRSVLITHNYDIYYKDICVSTLKVTSEDYFTPQNLSGKIQGNTTYTVDNSSQSIIEALTQHHLHIMKDYLFGSFKLDKDKLIIETRHFENHSLGTNIRIRNKYNIHLRGIPIGEASFTGNFEMRNGKMQGGIKHQYTLSSTLEKRKRAKVSI
jgi:hypothetical protein